MGVSQTNYWEEWVSQRPGGTPSTPQDADDIVKYGWNICQPWLRGPHVVSVQDIRQRGGEEILQQR